MSKIIERTPLENFDIRVSQRSGATRRLIQRPLLNSEGVLQGPRSGKSEAVARDFLNAQKGLQGLSSSQASSPYLVLEQEFRTGNGGLTHLVFRESYDGIPVFGGQTQVHVLDDGSILRANLPRFAGGPKTGISHKITAVNAMRVAEDALGGSAIKASSAGRSPQATELTEDYYKDLPSPTQIYFPFDEYSELAWDLYVPDLDDGNVFHVIMSSEDGSLLYSRNLTVDTEPEGTAFRAPRSLSGSDAGVPNPDLDARTVESFTGYPATGGDCPAPIYSGGTDCWATFHGSPFNSYFTVGNNVFSGEDYNGDGVAFTSCSDPSGHLDFPFTNEWEVSGTFPPDSCAAITNIFYWTNVAHGWFYALGFDEAAGNFQEDNFGRGGLQSDRVTAKAHNLLNNATFVTLPDGSNPIMQMCLFDSARRADSAFDPDVIVHEYGHGVTNRLVGGASNANAISNAQSGAMGEGWSDTFAFSLMDDPVMGEYVTGNSTIGIRSHSYDNSPWTYGQFGNISQITLNGGFPVGLPEVHDDGEIWAASLYDVREMMASTDPTNRKDNFEKLLITSLALTPSNPSMLGARDAILLAADLSGSGTTSCDVWGPFADRGFGYSAQLNHVQSGSPNDAALSLYEAFDVPLTCHGYVLLPGPTVFSDDMVGSCQLSCQTQNHD